jgi:hypothetical protein
MHNWLILNIQQNTEVELSETQIDNLNKLYNDHVEGKIDIHRYLKIIYKQVSIGLQDLYDRFYYVRDNIRPKDSSSLKSHIARYGEVEGTRMFNEKTSKCVQSLEKFIKKYGVSEGTAQYKLYCVSKTHTLESYIMRYGDDHGPKRWREYWDNTKFGTSLKHFIARYGEEEGKVKYNEFKTNQGFNNTLEGFISRYGPAFGPVQYEEKYRKSAISNSKETLVNKLVDQGLGLIEIFDKIDKRWNQTSVEAFKRRYGEHDGVMKYEAYIQQNKKKNPVCVEYYLDRGIDKATAVRIIKEIQTVRRFGRGNTKRASTESLRYLTPIANAVNKQFDLYYDFEYKIRLTNEEKAIESTNTNYIYDLCFPDMNVIIEYHGSLFHKDCDYDKTKTMALDDHRVDFCKDLFKKWVAESRGFDVFIIRSWNLESDLHYIYDFFRLKGMDESWKPIFYLTK